MSKDIREGDIVHVRGKVWKVVGPVVNGKTATVNVDICDPVYGSTIIAVTGDVIVKVEPRPLKVGDKVNWTKSSYTMTIVAIDGAMAWVRSPNCDRLVPLDELEGE